MKLLKPCALVAILFTSTISKAQSYVPPPPPDQENYDTQQFPPIDQEWLIIALLLTASVLGLYYYQLLCARKLSKET